MLLLADEDRESVRLLSDAKRVNSAFKLLYDALHGLTEALIAFDKVKSYNHECLFAHLCTTHGELKLDWELLERTRKMRNRLQYYGDRIGEMDWEVIEAPIAEQCRKMREAIGLRMQEGFEKH